MIAFPRISRLKTVNYQLYPGEDRSGVFDLHFDVGPWVILGVNGIGKSTLLLLLKHVILGPFESRTTGFSGEQSSELRSLSKDTFATRVDDRAKDAEATVECIFADQVLRTTRRLKDMSLIAVQVDTEIDNVSRDVPANEEAYQQLLCELMGVQRFEDAVNIFERMIFKLEKGPELLWDASAQLQIFKALLEPSLSPKMRELEARIISADSRARNVLALLGQTERRIEKLKVTERSEAATLAKIEALRAEAEALEAELREALEVLDEIEERRSDARLYLKRDQKRAEDAAQAYEVSKVKVLRSLFSTLDENTTYIVAKVLADKTCPLCGEETRELAKLMDEHLRLGKCALCGSPGGGRKGGRIPKSIRTLQEAAQRDYLKFQACREDVSNRSVELEGLETSHKKKASSVSKLRENLQAIHKKVRTLEKNLPPEDRLQRREAADQINAWRMQINKAQEERARAEAEYYKYILRLRESAERIRRKLSVAFKRHAEPFFAGQVRLVYEPRTRRIGQVGESFEFPAFEVEMNAGEGSGAFVRRQGNQVSLSQREYLDVIFRMSLIDIIGGSSGTSFVFDGPEGSVDAVFGDRAGKLFSSFAAESRRNIIMACNVVEGGLIPYTLSAFKGQAERKSRIVNLLQRGRATNALRELRDEYEGKVKTIISYKIR